MTQLPSMSRLRGKALTDLRKEALKLAAAGTAVLPLRDKRPINPNGFHGATADAEQVKAFDWPSANGIGAAIPPGTFVVDIDPRSGGDRTVEALKNAGMFLPATRVHRTQGGGTHRFYHLTEEHAESRLRGQLGPGVDIKASGKGYVVVPPTPGYEVQWDVDSKPAPEWMLNEIVKPEVKGDNFMGRLPKFFDQWEVGTDYGTKALEGEIGRLMLTQEGGRNNALNRAAFSMAQLSAGGELLESEALDKLRLAGERMGLPADEVEQTVTSGWEAGLQEPREAPGKSEEFINPQGDTVLISTGTKDQFSLESGGHDEEHFWLDWENADDTPPPFYLHPMVPKNAYVLVYGATEASKSMAFVALAAQGSHLGLKSSVYSLENPSHIDIDRVRRLGPHPVNFRISNQMMDLNDPAQVHAMVDREKEFGTDWLIIDTYSHAFNSRTEDGNAKAIEFARRIRFLMSKVGCTVILVDHTGYADHGEPRDASAKRQQVDVAIKMKRPDGWEWAPGKDAVFIMENHKSARFGNPFMLTGRICDVKPGRGLRLEWNQGQTQIPEWRV